MRLLASLFTLALPLSLLAAKAPEAPLPLMEATSQVMLAERIGKAYAWRGIEPDSSDAKSQLEQASKQFEKQLALLKPLAKNNPDLKSAKPDDKTHADEMLENFSTLEQVWGEYQKLTAAPPTREGGQKLAESAEEVVLFSQRTADAITERAAYAARPVIIAESVATLSQRLARIYLLQSWGIKMPFLAKDLAAAREKFDIYNKQLWALPSNTTSVKAQLDLLKSQWLFFQQAIDELAKNNNDKQLQKNVITTSERIFQVSGELAATYQRAVK